jgi:hypothetical protein
VTETTLEFDPIGEKHRHGQVLLLNMPQKGVLQRLGGNAPASAT